MKEFELHRAIEALEKQRNKLSDQIAAKRTKLEKICTHPSIKNEEEYIEGSYYDRGYWVKRKVCKICGTELSKETKSGGYG